jgi:pantetheine-phosphate adenylyltransferase
MNKANKHIIESLTDRIDHVRSFLTSFKPGLEYDIASIQDVYGPTAVDPDIQGLIVSKETLSGGIASGSIHPPLQTLDSNLKFMHS